MDLADLFGDYLPEPLEDSHSVEDVLIVDDLPQDQIIHPLAVASGAAPEQATKEAELGETGESSRGAGSRKRGRASAPTLHFKTPSKKKKEEEDVCFICFDGGDLVCCKRRGCPKVYHPACVDLDKGLMQSKSEWNCSWHMCNICVKASHYACYTCAYSLCKGCMKEAEFLCIRGNKGFCGSCFQTVLQIEQNVQTNKGMTEVDFNDKIRWEYLFKQYWLDLKGKLSLTLEELNRASNSLKGSGKSSNKEPFDGQFDANGDQCTSSDSFSENTKAGNSKTGKGKNQARTSTGKGGKNQPSTSTGKGEKNQPSSSAGKGGKNQASASTGKGGKNQASTSTGKGVSSATSDGTEWDADDFPEFDESASAKTDSRKKRKSRRRIEEKGASKRRIEDRRPQVNPNDYAAIDMHNINLIYLRRNLMEDLLVDLEKFHDMVVGSYVRIRTSGMDQMPDMHRLVQVVGTGKAVEAYQSGRMMTDFVLEILNLDKTEFISIDTISNQGFTEEECRSLHQGIKSGLNGRLKVGEIQKKAMSLQEVRLKDWLETETSRLCNVRDRANEKGRRKELRECLKQLELLSSPDERARRFEEIPDIHVDPKMDPKYDSIEEEGHPDNTKQDNCMKPKAVELSIKGKDTISPGEGAFASSCEWNMASSSVVQEIISTPPSTETAVPSEISETDKIWHYQDRSSKIQGPFSMTQLRKWSKHFPTSLRIWKTSEQQEDSKLLTDVLGEFQEPLSWDKSADGWDTQASKSEIPTDGGWASKSLFPTTTPSCWGDAGASAAVGNSSNKQDPSGNWKPLTSSNSWATMSSTDTSLPSNSGWGTGAATENPNTDWGIASQGNAGTEWGAASAPAKEGNAGSGWGAASAAAQGENTGPGWGAASAAAKEGNAGSGWGAASAPAKEGNAGSVWGAASAAAQGENAGSGWGATPAAAKDGNVGSGWGATPAAAKEGNVGSGWGATSAPAKEGNAGSGWGAASAAAQGENAGTGWGAASAAAMEGNAGSGWGASQKSADGGWKASTWENVNKGSEASAGNSSTWGATQGNANAGWKTGTWETSGGNGSGGHGGGGPGSCYKCGEQGHMAKDCPKGGGGGSGSCYKCGEPGHMARDCPKGGSGGSCFKCGETGHMARDCPKGGSGGGSGSCYKCGEAGHMARDCPKGGSGGGGSCYKCGESGHMARDCPKGGSGGGGSCYKCGESGHMARDCPKGGSGGSGSCYKCGESGHMARDCPKGGGGGGSCYKCGESGHMARDCPKGGSGGGGSFYKCGELGHMSRDCPKGGSGGGGSCYKCGESGHMARDCPKGSSGGGGGSCYKCGESGHMARDCPQGSRSGGGGSCYKCGESGHMARDCPKVCSGGGGGSCYKCGGSGHMARECRRVRTYGKGLPQGK